MTGQALRSSRLRFAFRKASTARLAILGSAKCELRKGLLGAFQISALESVTLAQARPSSLVDQADYALHQLELKGQAKQRSEGSEFECIATQQHDSMQPFISYSVSEHTPCASSEGQRSRVETAGL